MADATYGPKVYLGAGGDRLTIASGGVLDLETGAQVNVNGAQATALTAGLTTLTHTAPDTPDYAIQNVTQTAPYGFVTADEANTVLKVIANLQTKVAELEALAESLGLVAAN